MHYPFFSIWRHCPRHLRLQLLSLYLSVRLFPQTRRLCWVPVIIFVDLKHLKVLKFYLVWKTTLKGFPWIHPALLWKQKLPLLDIRAQVPRRGRLSTWVSKAGRRCHIRTKLVQLTSDRKKRIWCPTDVLVRPPRSQSRRHRINFVGTLKRLCLLSKKPVSLCMRKLTLSLSHVRFITCCSCGTLRSHHLLQYKHICSDHSMQRIDESGYPRKSRFVSSMGAKMTKSPEITY